MPWARIDDRANSDAKLLALSDSAFRLWVGALIFCQANLTDGFIPTEAIETFGVRAKNKTLLVRELTQGVLRKKPLWQEVAGGWQINDFMDWNDSRDVVLKQRKKGKDRVDRFRAKLNGVSNGVSNATCNALQTPNERSLFAASTTTTKDQNQDPRPAPFPHPVEKRRRQQPATRVTEIRAHLRSSCHDLIEGPDAQYHAGHPTQEVNLFDQMKWIAADRFHCEDYNGTEIRKIIDAVLGARARRSA